jgi:hypothetical protein
MSEQELFWVRYYSNALLRAENAYQRNLAAGHEERAMQWKACAEGWHRQLMKLWK